MSDVDAAPAAETDTAETSGKGSMADILANRHQRQAAHEPHAQVGDPVDGDDDDEDDLDPAPAAQPAPAAAPAAAEPAPAAAAPAAAEAADPADDPKAPKWYRDHMRQTRRALAERDAEIARLRTGPQPQPAPQAQPQSRELPNPAEDPVGFANAIQEIQREQWENFQLQTRVNTSADRHRDKLGEEAFDELTAWLSTKPEMEDWCLKQPDPWGAAHKQFTREQLAEEIGDDPKAWQEKERQRLREELLAEMGGERQPAPAAAPRMGRNPPPPASTARSAAPRDPSGRFAGPAPLRTRNNFG